MEEYGFLRKHGYGKNSPWRFMMTILGILFICSIFFIGYSIYDGKITVTASPNILCEKQVCELTCPACPSNNMSCEPIINITINPIIA